MKFSSKPFLLAAVFFPLTAFSQTVVFRTAFDYAGGAPAIDELAEDLNGADGQIGTFSGDLPLGADGFGGDQLITIRTSNEDPAGTYLVADRGTEDFALSANFTDPLELTGARVSFDIGTSRTGTDHNKDNQIIGFSASGEEVFHLWVSARNDTTADGLRLGYEGVDTGGIVWDIPLNFGNDASGDIDFFNGDIDDPTGTVPATVNLTLNANGFSIDYRSSGSNTGFLKLYQSRTLPYNGPGTDLARIEFRGKGGDNNDVRGGFWLDDISANGTLVPQPPFVLEITDLSFDPESRNARVTFSSEDDVQYQASRSEDLLTWTPFNTVMARTGSETTFIDANIPVDVLKRFYRVAEVPN